MTTAQFVVRMPPELREWVASAAERNERSMNWLIVSILKGAMDAHTKNAPAVDAAEAPI